MDINWYICAHEVLKTSGMIKMKMANNDSLDVLDIVASGFDGV